MRICKVFLFTIHLDVFAIFCWTLWLYRLQICHVTQFQSFSIWFLASWPKLEGQLDKSQTRLELPKCTMKTSIERAQFRTPNKVEISILFWKRDLPYRAELLGALLHPKFGQKARKDIGTFGPNSKSWMLHLPF